MYYPSYDDYMRDIFYFGGLATPRNNFMSNSYMNNNLSNLYPSIYRIIYPVVERVISSNNYQFANEEMVNNMTNTIYDIVEGDINLNQSQANSNQNSSTLSKPRNYVKYTITELGTQSTNNSQNINYLLKDLIKILVIRELISKSNMRYFPYNQPLQPPYYMNGMM